MSRQTGKEFERFDHFHAPKYISLNEGADLYHTSA
jgi:hypothetical protein